MGINYTQEKDLMKTEKNILRDIILLISLTLFSMTACFNGDSGSDNSSGPAPHRDFWCWNLSVMPPGDDLIPSTLQGETENVLIYVSDKAWQDGLVTEAQVSNIKEAVGYKTPANPDEGIYSINTSVFGNPPDIDRNEKIVILYTDLKGYGEHKFDGFFSALHEGEELMDYHSNNCDMIFLDCKNNTPDSDYLLGVLAHEFQHMIQWKQDADEESWLNETLSQAAMVLCGYNSDLSAGINYLKNKTSTQPVTDSSHGGYAYGTGFLFSSYIIDRFGSGIISKISRDKLTGVYSLNSILKDYDCTDFYDLVLDWAAAAIINDSGLENGKYDYGRFRDDIEAPVLIECNYDHTITFGTTEDPGLPSSAYTYLEYNCTSGQNINISITKPETIRLQYIIMSGDSAQETAKLEISGGQATITPGIDGKIIFIVVSTCKDADTSVKVSGQ